MGQYRISELNIEIETNSSTLIKNLARYETSFDYRPNLSLSITNDIMLDLMEEYAGHSADVIECEYISTEYARSLFDFNGFPLRATAVECDDCCVLFCCPFKEERICDLLPQDKIFAIDCPGIRLIDGIFYAYGTPFGLDGHRSKDIKLPIKAIVYVDAESYDSLKRLDTKNMVNAFIRSVMLAIRGERTKHSLFMLEKLMKVVDLYGVSDLKDVDFILEKVTDN